MCCDELQSVLRYPKLSMLFEARAACRRCRMCERGEGMGGDGRRGTERGDGGKKESKLQIVWIRHGCFFSIFSSNLTYCYTAAGRLIHSSAGSQYLSSNYRRIFLLSLAVTHRWITSPSAIRKGLPELQRKKKPITWVLHMPEDLNINNLLVVPWQNTHLTDFFFPFSWITFTWQCQVHNPATILFLPTGGVIASVFSVVMCCQKSLGSRCSRLLGECDNFVPRLWNSLSILGKLISYEFSRLVHSR